MRAQACGFDSHDVLLGDLTHLSAGNEAGNEARMKVQWAQVPEARALARAATRPMAYSVGTISDC